MKLLEKIINQETYMVNWDEVAKIPEFGVLKKLNRILNGIQKEMCGII
jgi:hypothetical protein